MAGCAGHLSSEESLMRTSLKNHHTIQRMRVVIRGAVQGVGFRPFVFRLAHDLELAGWVVNSAQGVVIEVEGIYQKLRDFHLRLETEKPPLSFIYSLESSYLDPVGYTDFEVRQSDDTGKKTALVLPDIATCSDCLKEVFDPADRRYLYPFTNCTNCGPRYSIIESLPYDRSNTTMKQFTMCKECQAEYEDPHDRRFHAQPNACPKCGPYLELWDGEGKTISSRHEALQHAAEALRGGEIIASKGLGGFHLMVDARNENAVLRLRSLKGREEKPFALMFPNLGSIGECCRISDLEERLLKTPESPIVLLRRSNRVSGCHVTTVVAPGNPYLGIMLPYTPLHHLLMAELGFAVVATSGNLSDEPICTDECEALDRLRGIADKFLVHNRPIFRHVDDSVASVVKDRELILRRARGYAPLPIRAKDPMPSLMAVGGHLKNTIAISIGRQAFVSQHIGDLETTQAFKAFRRVGESFSTLYDFQPESVVCDLHPDYHSTKVAEKLGFPLIRVQHHYAHVAACMAENELEGPLLGVSWDGTGYGTDDTIWGGEFLRVTESSWRREAHFRTFRLPGGEKAIKEPRRAALGLLFEIYGDEAFSMTDIKPVGEFSHRELDLLKTMVKKGINSPLTSSAGRLFDAVCAVVGIRQISRFEGQSAMELEFSLHGIQTDDMYKFRIDASQSPIIVDWEDAFLEIVDDVGRGVPAGLISARFHNGLVEAVVEIAGLIGEKKVILTGGCFQNRYLTERAVSRLETEGFRPYWHQRIPPNDGGIALGQIAAASRLQRRS